MADERDAKSKDPNLDNVTEARQMAKAGILASMGALDPAQGRGLQQAIGAGILALLSGAGGGGSGPVTVDLQPVVSAIGDLRDTLRDHHLREMKALGDLRVSIDALAKVGLPKP